MGVYIHLPGGIHGSYFPDYTDPSDLEAFSKALVGSEINFDPKKFISGIKPSPLLSPATYKIKEALMEDLEAILVVYLE